jgi:hypothetical protein
MKMLEKEIILLGKEVKCSISDVEDQQTRMVYHYVWMLHMYCEWMY